MKLTAANNIFSPPSICEILNREIYGNPVQGSNSNWM